MKLYFNNIRYYGKKISVILANSKWIVPLIIVFIMFLSDRLLELEIFYTIVYCAPPEGFRTIAQVNSDILFWQSDLDNLGNFKIELVRQFRARETTAAIFNSEWRVVNDSIETCQHNIQHFIREKAEIQQHLNITNEPVLGKRKERE